MQFTETVFNDDAEAMIACCGAFDVVLGIAILQYEGDEDLYELSKGAVMRGMEIFRERYITRFNALNPDKNVENYFYPKITGEPKGERISFEEFLGSNFNWEEETHELFGHGNQVRSIESENAGLLYALVNPPYGVRLPSFQLPMTKENGKLVDEECARFCKSFVKDVVFLNKATKEDLEIFRWSDDWSNYFDPGKEWWGTFCWTIFNRKANAFIVIAASTSD